MPGIAAIYMLRNTNNGKRYIGSAIDWRKRRNEHFMWLRRGQHRNMHLQNAFNKHREDAFECVVLQTVEDPGDLISLEQYYLDILSPEYNICLTAGSALGVKRSLETRRRMSRSKQGHRHTQETRRKMSRSRMGALNPQYGQPGTFAGRHHTEETLRKISEANKGKIISEKTRLAISENNRTRVITEETRRKISRAGIGRKHTPETRQKIAEANRGRMWTDESRKKLAAAHRGKTATEETSRKMSESRKAYLIHKMNMDGLLL